MAIRVILSGVAGRTGREVGRYLAESPHVRLVAGVGERSAGRTLAEVLGIESAEGQVAPDLEAAYRAAGGAEVLVDFSHARAAEAMLPVAIRLGLKAVVGTTGLGAEVVAALAPLVERFGGAVALIPNFSLGALLLADLAVAARRRLPSAEIIEMHGSHKRDRPSGTALWLAERMGGDVPIHAVRLPGLVAHHAVLFGGEGETLTIRHDVLSRRAFGPGVLAAVRAIAARQGLFTSLADLLAADTPPEGSA
jgi:4-hydroxy-tetrahydrodipicolinate reductase